MTNVGIKTVSNLRSKFRVIDREALRWFPGHMSKGLRQMQQRLKSVDCIIEVHDARVPISGRNPEFSNTIIGLKPHIYVLNKKDLADLSNKEQVTRHLQKSGVKHILYTNAKDQMCKEYKKILPLASDLISNTDRFNRTGFNEFSIMVIGVPNVGKSSLINRLRALHLKAGKATQVGGVAGITRSVLTRIKISEKPPVYLHDTPGILTPYVGNTFAGLKLASVGCLQDHLVGQQTLADYMLFWLNQQGRFEYVEALGLKEPTDDILHVLIFIAAKLKKTLKLKSYDGSYNEKPNLLAAAEHFIKLFRSGEFGKICMDRDLVELR